jgi:hypothetical protein
VRQSEHGKCAQLSDGKADSHAGSMTIEMYRDYRDKPSRNRPRSDSIYMNKPPSIEMPDLSTMELNSLGLFVRYAADNCREGRRFGHRSNLFGRERITLIKVSFLGGVWQVKFSSLTVVTGSCATTVAEAAVVGTYNPQGCTIEMMSSNDVDIR